jgi:hypothetical protein
MLLDSLNSFEKINNLFLLQMACRSSICDPNQKYILNCLIEEINLNPFIRVSRHAGDEYCNLAADKLRIIITGVCNARCQASPIQELDVETYHICIKEASSFYACSEEGNILPDFCLQSGP